MKKKPFICYLSRWYALLVLVVVTTIAVIASVCLVGTLFDWSFCGLLG